MLQFTVTERNVGAKHQQLLSGVSLPAYWTATAVFDVSYFVFMGFVIIAVTAAFGAPMLLTAATRK